LFYWRSPYTKQSSAIYEKSKKSAERIEDIDAPLLAETKATIKDGYLNVVSYGTATT